MSEAPAALAAEAESDVSKALTELDRIIDDTDRYGGAIRAPLVATRAALRAQHRMLTDGMLGFQQLMATAKRPLDPEELARLEKTVAQGIVQGAQRFAYAQIERAAKWDIFRYAAAAVGATILVAAVCFGIAWWIWAPQQCQVMHGGYVCYEWKTQPTS